MMATYNQNCNKTSNRCIPIPIAAGFSDQNRIKNKIAKSKLNTTFKKKLLLKFETLI